MHDSKAARGAAAAATLIALAGLFGLGWTVSHVSTNPTGTSPRASPSTAARTALPGLMPPASDPTLPSLATLTPSRGTAVQAPGPFDDRLTLTALTFDGARVSGTATITSDVSDVLEFQALAGFYDNTGTLLGTASFTYHRDEAHDHAGQAAGASPNEQQRFSIIAPAHLLGRAVSAAVGVPVLVNE